MKYRVRILRGKYLKPIYSHENGYYAAKRYAESLAKCCKGANIRVWKSDGMSVTIFTVDANRYYDSASIAVNNW